MNYNCLNRMFMLFLVIISILSTSSSVAGDAIKGSEEKSFQSALSNWLSGKDEIALSAFSELAQNENRAAQIFLAEVETKPWLHHRVTKSLTRKSKIALLRNPIGLSGRSWLYSAASDTPLAQYFIDARKPIENTKNVVFLLDANELSLALPLISRIGKSRNDYSAAKLLLHKNVITYSSGYLQEMADQLDSSLPFLKSLDPDNSLIVKAKEMQNLIRLNANSAGNDRLLWVSLDYRTILKIEQVDSSELKQFGNSLLEVKHLESISAIVKRSCIREEAEALATLQIASYGSPLFYSTFSPVESLLSSNDYRQSKRFESDILGRLNFFAMSRNLAKRLNSCAYRLISDS